MLTTEAKERGFHISYAYSRSDMQGRERKDELDSFLRLLSKNASQNLVNASNSEG